MLCRSDLLKAEWQKQVIYVKASCVGMKAVHCLLVSYCLFFCSCSLLVIVSIKLLVAVVVAAAVINMQINLL